MHRPNAPLFSSQLSAKSQLSMIHASACKRVLSFKRIATRVNFYGLQQVLHILVQRMALVPGLTHCTMAEF